MRRIHLSVPYWSDRGPGDAMTPTYVTGQLRDFASTEPWGAYLAEEAADYIEELAEVVEVVARSGGQIVSPELTDAALKALGRKL